jgi:hypothetical protein
MVGSVALTARESHRKAAFRFVSLPLQTLRHHYIGFSAPAIKRDQR